MGLNFDFGHSKVPKMPFFGFGTVKTAGLERFFNEKIFFSFFFNLITKRQLKLMSFHEKCHFAPK